MPPGYLYPSSYLAAAAPGGLVPLQASQLTHAAAVAAAATQFYDYQNAAAAAATYPAAAAAAANAYNFADAYPSYAAAAGMSPIKVATKAPELVNGAGLRMAHPAQTAHNHQQHQQQQQQTVVTSQANGGPGLVHHRQLEKAALLPQFLPSMLRGNGSPL